MRGWLAPYTCFDIARCLSGLPAENGVRIPPLLPFAVAAFFPGYWRISATGAFSRTILLHQRVCVNMDMLDTDPLIGVANIDTPFAILDHTRVGELALSVVDNSLPAVNAMRIPLQKKKRKTCPLTVSSATILPKPFGGGLSSSVAALRHVLPSSSETDTTSGVRGPCQSISDETLPIF